MADYIHLFMEEGEELTISEDWAASLVTEVFHLCLFHNLLTILFQSLFIHLIQSTIPSSGFTENMSGRSYQTNGRFDACRCNSAVGGGFAGVTCCGSIRSPFK